MAKYYFTRKAIQDLNFILDYTVEEWSEAQAAKYYALIINGCKEVSQNPSIGKKYFDVYPGLYGQYLGRHIIFYRIIDKDLVEVERILHENMDIRSKFSEPH